jgi:hypothetical protein
MRKIPRVLQTTRWTSTWERQLLEFKPAEYALFEPCYRTKAPGGGGGGMPGGGGGAAKPGRADGIPGGGGGGMPDGGGDIAALLAGTTSVVVLA